MKALFLSFILTSLTYANYYDIKPVKVNEDISCIIGDYEGPNKKNNGLISNVCYVDIGNSIVVLDAGPTYNFAKELSQLIKKQYPTKSISHVVLTNYHDDRTLGASYFKEKNIKIVGHNSINSDIDNHQTKFGRMHSSLNKNVYNKTKITKANTLFDKEFIIKGSKKELKLIKLTKKSQEFSDIIVYSKNDSFIFAGNLIFNERILSFSEESDINGWIEAINKIKAFKADYIVGGHGEIYYENAYITTLSYLETLKKELKKAYDEGLDLEEVSEYTNTESFSKLKNYKPLNNRNIYNYYMQLEMSE